MLSRLRKLVFNIRRQRRAERYVEIMRRLNRLARLMTVMQRKSPGAEGERK
jgi:hypothetical protein